MLNRIGCNRNERIIDVGVGQVISIRIKHYLNSRAVVEHILNKLCGVGSRSLISGKVIFSPFLYGNGVRGDILAVSIELNLNRLAHHVGIEIESVSVIFDAASSCNRHAAKRHGYILINKFFGTVESNGDFFTLIAGRSLVEVIVQTDLAFERNRYVVNENGRIDLSQAEAVMQIVGATGEMAERCAMRQLDGAAGAFVRDVSEKLLARNLRFAGIEALFQTDDAPVVSDEHIAWLHQNGLCIWGNAIVYDERAVIAGTHTDDTAVTGDPDTGWGWYQKKGFDLVQTDHLAAAKAYFERQNHDDV